MKKSLRLLSLGIISLLSTSSLDAQMTANLLFAAKMDGAQETPAVTTDAMGVASFMLNEQRDQLCVNVAVNGLSGDITAAHIHDGVAGVSGSPIVDLSGGIVGNQIAMKITGANLTSSLIEKLMNGAAYINVHTADNPNGEIRGQIMLETDFSFVATADGAQETPAVVTNAYGVGVFNLSKDNNMMRYLFIAQGLSGAIISAHLHIGPAGVPGSIEEDLTGDVFGNVIMGNFTPTMGLLNNIMNGNVYVNVHTGSNPGGEIRGQLLMETGLAFDAALTGSQETPPVTTMARGVAKLTVNSTFDGIDYDIVSDGLSGAITAAHIHAGAVGVPGGPIVDLSGSISGNRIMGTISGASVTSTLINAMLRGELYVNVHTAANPNGEIRGQIYRLAREGYTTLLTGGQEVPANSTSAYGAGVVSINRDEDNLHYMMVVGDLTSPIVAAHFHHALPGVDGLPIFDISTSFNGLDTIDAAFGFLTDADVTPFTSTEAALFANGEIYVNVHNADYPGGEIRGQIDPGQVCYSLAAVEELTSEDFEVYPNPFTDLLMLSSEDMQSLANITLFNMEGKEIITLDPENAEQLFKINTSTLHSGMYLLKTTTNDGKSFHSQVVKR